MNNKGSSANMRNEKCSSSEIYAAWEMHSSDRLWAKHYWNTNDKSADCWQTVQGIFVCVCVWSGGCRLMVCRSLLPSSQRQHTVWIEIVCSCGSACQLLHRICIIQQPRGRGEWGARGEGTRHGEELAYRKREHSLGLNKLTETDWLRGRVADVNVHYFFFLSSEEPCCGEHIRFPLCCCCCCALRSSIINYSAFFIFIIILRC